MRAVVIVAAILASMAFSPAQARKEPRSVDLTTKSVRDLAGCVALKLSAARGYEITSTDTAAGIELKMKFRIAGVPATAATFAIEDVGQRRRLTIFATGKASGAPRQIAEGVRECAD